ncbi:MAG: peptidylprolyl isomerase [Bifidobacteriaceae bacterium]|jgi:peptidyl-prolyl cis-trans isomerase B (cyclophilin B)|nr:peptidylprolyl isomerase [Bifidobacteriaceae bacterium]
MGKRNLKRERERRRALARQQRMIAAAERRRRRQLAIGITVPAIAVVGVAAVIVMLLVNREDTPTPTTSETPTETVDASGATEETADPGSTPRATYTAVPDPALAEGREWTGEIVTSVGTLGITLDGAAAPQATANFIQLAGDGYYNASSCHRLTTDGIFVLQCGSLTGDGTDNPGYQFGPVENAPADEIYPTGTIAMARAASEDSQGAQFFIVYEPSTIPGGYSVFGQVTSGLEAIEQVAAAGTADGSTDGTPATAVIIEWIELK